MKKVLSLAVAAIMAMSVMLLTACGVDKDKMKGDWIIDTIGGKPAAEWAAEQGVDEGAIQTQFSVSDDKTSVTLASGSKTDYDNTWRSNGVELKEGDTLKYSLLLDDKDKVSTKLDFGTGGEDVVLKKGTLDDVAAGGDVAEGEEVEGDEAAEEEAAE